MLGLVLGGGIAVLAIVAGLILFVRGSTPLVTAESLDAAEQRWRQSGPTDYQMDLTLTGLQAGEIHIEVHHGEVTSMVRNGQTPKQRRTWDYWSVPNQFEMIRQDLESAQQPAQAFGASDRSQFVMRADFDPHYGYPIYYQRIVLGTPHDISWRVTRFTPSH